MKKKVMALFLFGLLVILSACGGLTTGELTTNFPENTNTTVETPTTVAPTTQAPTTAVPTTGITTATPTTQITTETPTTVPTTEPPVKTRVYFYNVVGWGEVYAYSFAGEIHHLGEWPGTLATQDGSSLWYYADVEVDTDVDSFKIIFNNGLGMQSGEVTIDDDINVYVSMLLEVKYSSKTAIESLIQPDETTTIWFYNSLGWDSVHAYFWGTYGTFTGDWPGFSTIKDGETDWWSITIPFDTGQLPILMKFNDGSGAQTPELSINTSGPHFYTVLGNNYLNKEEAEASLLITSRVYFYNTNFWDSVIVYEESGLLGDWPGVIATNELDSDWWYIDVIGDSENTTFNFKFHNDQAVYQETFNVLVNDTNGLFVTVNSQTFLTKEAAEASIYPETMTTVWFYNSDNWYDVYAYVYVDTEQYFGNWHGKLAAQDGGTDWWSIEVPLDSSTQEFMIVFNNGYTLQQTADATINSTSGVFITMDGEVHLTKALAEEHLLVYTRIYFYNSNDWTNVFAYEHYGLLGAWPGTQATKELESNWWYVDVLGDIEETSFTIKFHNSDVVYRETDNVVIDSTTGVYVTVNARAFLTPQEAENTILPLVMTQVWFYNSDNWPNVNAYVYDAYYTYLGKWPGAEVYQDIEPDWWVIGVPLDVAESDFIIIFNDGVVAQTPDVTITESTGLYITVDGVIHTSKALAEEHMAVYTRIYFLNSNNWMNVIAYEQNNLLGDWPGIQATKEVDSDWWYVDVPGDIAITTFQMKFHNGEPDFRETFLTDVSSSTGVYVTVNSKAYLTLETAETTIYPAVTTTLWFLNSEDWATVNAFVFIETDNYLGKYPGKLAVKEELTDWWSIEVPLDVLTTDFYIIFSDGGFVNKTPDTLITSSDNLYVTVDGSVHESKALAEEHVLVYTRIYFYNYNDWNTVWAYEEHNLLGGWPGVVAEKEVDSDWWYVDVIGDINEVEFLIKFHNNEPILRQTYILTINSTTGVYTTVNSTVHSTKEEVENFFNPAVTTTIYFLNTEGWSEVSAYAYFDSTEYIGNWPGKLATKESEFSDWWTIEVPLDIIMAEFNIIFSDGTNTYQTSDIIINGISGLYVLPNGVTYSTKGDAEYNAYPLTTVYFYNDLGWTDVYAYVFIDTSEYLGSWPGTVALKEVDSDWWSIDVPVNVEPGAFTIVFNDGIDQQTPNVVIDTLAGIYVVPDGSIFESEEDAKSYLYPVTTIYFYNSDGWTDVWVEAYNTDDPDSMNYSLQLMQEGTTDWWYVDVPVDATVTILELWFHDMISLYSGTAYLTSDINVYLTMRGYTFSSKLEAEESMLETFTRVYFYNNQWLDVWVYVEDEITNPFGGAPGVQATQDSSTNWWYVDVPLDAAETPFYIYFNDGSAQVAAGSYIEDDLWVYTIMYPQIFATRPEAELALIPTTMYFYNSGGWTTVSAEAYNTFGSIITPLLGESGMTITQDGTSNWWYVDVPANPDWVDFNIRFFEGSNTTPEVWVYSKFYPYITIDGAYHETKLDAETYLSISTRIYYYNSEGWSSVYAYAYLASDDTYVLTNNWNGTLATQDGTSDWWYIDLYIDTAIDSIIIIFNDGSGDQTQNILIDTSTDVYVTHMNALYSNKTSAENSLLETTIYFYNSDFWAEVYAYVYSDEGDLIGSWPGTQAVQDGVTMYWTVDVPVNPIYHDFVIIFHDNYGTETPSTYITDTLNIYATVLGTTYSTQMDAETAVATALANNTIIATRISNAVVGTKTVGVWTWGEGLAGQFIVGTYNYDIGTFTVNLPEDADWFILVVLNDGETTLAGDWTNVYRQSSNQAVQPNIIVYNGYYYVA